MVHYTFFDSLIPHSITHSADWQKTLTAIGLGALMLLGGRALARRLQTREGAEAAVIPTRKVTLFGFVDFAVENWIKFQDTILGKENRRHAPFTASIFFFIFIANLVGLIPGFPAATTTVWVNVGMALVVFFYFNAVGVKANGFWNYLKHFAGPVWWLAFLIFPLEILSTTLRILTLNLRLYWNVSADHLVLGIFTDLIPFGVPIVFYALGTFVALMQAFIFSLLTMVYIRLASEHQEDEGEAHHGHEH